MLCKVFSLNAKDDSSLVMTDCLWSMIAESPGLLSPVHCRPSVFRATCRFLWRKTPGRPTSRLQMEQGNVIISSQSCTGECFSETSFDGLFFFLLKCFLFHVSGTSYSESAVGSLVYNCLDFQNTLRTG